MTIKSVKNGKCYKFNKNLHKLSKNKMKIYHELQKFLNKEQ